MRETTLRKFVEKNVKDYSLRIKKANPPFSWKKNNKVLLFGADILGKEFLKVCKSNNLKVMAICDNDRSKKGRKILGVKVISIDELKEYPKDTPIIVTIMHDFIVKEQLKKLGYTSVFGHTYFAALYPEKFHYFTWQSSQKALKNGLAEVLELYRLLKDKKSKKVLEQLITHRLTLDHEDLVGVVDEMDKEYFDPSIIMTLENEVFVDGGGFDGDTIKKYIHSSKNIFKEIHCFEPDSTSQKKIKTFLKKKKDNRIILHPFGLSNKNHLAFFSDTGTAGSKVNDGGARKIKLVSLDAYLYNKKPTFIKFDIEGSETDAIMGMKKIMRELKPKLAICIYHKPSDLWKVPLLIKKINPKYKIFIRHYTQTQHDTVCYAI